MWVDLDEPESWELAWVEDRLGVAVPADALGEDLEESAGFDEEEEDGGLHLRTAFLVMDDTGAQTMRVAFILHGKRLISVHRADSAVFRLLRMRARRMPGLVDDGPDALLALLMTDAEYSADALEGVYLVLENISQTIVRPGATDANAAEALAGIALQEDSNGRSRRNVLNTHRAVSLLTRSRRLSAEQIREASRITRDIDSLGPHSFSFRQDQLPNERDGGLHPHQPAQDRQVVLGGLGRAATPDAYRQHLWHEFQDHPGTRLAYGLPLCPGLDVGFRRSALLYLPPQGMAEIAGASAQGQTARKWRLIARKSAPSRGRCSYSCSAASQ